MKLVATAYRLARAALDQRPRPGQASIAVRDKLEKLLAEYGPIAITVYLSIFVLVMTGSYIAISQGFEVEGASATASTIGAAWVATKLTQPIRIAATLALTPAIGAGLKRRKTPS